MRNILHSTIGFVVTFLVSTNLMVYVDKLSSSNVYNGVFSILAGVLSALLSKLLTSFLNDHKNLKIIEEQHQQIYEQNCLISKLEEKNVNNVEAHTGSTTK
jgi:hypothetical protein